MFVQIRAGIKKKKLKHQHPHFFLSLSSFRFLRELLAQPNFLFWLKKDLNLTFQKREYCRNLGDGVLKSLTLFIYLAVLFKITHPRLKI